MNRKSSAVSPSSPPKTMLSDVRSSTVLTDSTARSCRTTSLGTNGAAGAINLVLSRLKEETPPTVEEVEQILVRTHIRTGRLIGNSQFASQWETPIGTYPDTLAALVADAARTLNIIPQRTDRGSTVADSTKDDADEEDSR
jgi:hypothetical protein